METVAIALGLFAFSALLGVVVGPCIAFGTEGHTENRSQDPGDCHSLKFASSEVDVSWGGGPRHRAKAPVQGLRHLRVMHDH